MNATEAHNNQVELLEEEVLKIRKIADIKNAEIETLIQQNHLCKVQQDMEMDSLRNEIVALKNELSLVDRVNFQGK